MGRADDRRARQRGARRAKSTKSGIRRLFTWKKILGSFFVLCLLVMGGFVALYLYVPMPTANADAELQSNVYKLSNGKVLARTGKVNREKVDLSEVPLDVQHTFVAAENMSFYKDHGVDFRGTARGLYNTLQGRKQGGSTITQQYVKNYYLSADQTVTRKLKELVVSLKVDRKFTKEDILAGYINTSYYGRGAFGIQAASQAYYGIDAKNLNVSQGAYLASLLQAPSQYDWAVATDEGKKLVQERWGYTLDNMVKMNWLDSAKRGEQKFQIPQKPKPEEGLKGETGYLVKAANQELEAQGLSEAEIDAGGWTVTLNIDPKKQAALEKTLKEQLTDKLTPKTRPVDADIEAGAVSVNPHTGAIEALYGGQDYLKHEISNAKRTDYQPASTFKPLILAAALESGAKTQDGKPITADTIYNGDSKRQVVDSNGNNVGFDPPNEDDHNYGPITVQTAMNNSVNSVFAQMGVDVGLGKIKTLGADLGMSRMKTAQAVPAMTLGSYGASPMEMAGVYATLDNHGKKVTPTIVKSATRPGREPLKMQKGIGDQVISRQTADAVTSVLTGVVDQGTGKVVKNKDQQVAGKTGTSDENKSAWFTGYTPNLVTSVGLFGEAAKTHTVNGKTVHQGDQVTISGAAGSPTGRINGGGFPAQIWAAFTFGLDLKPSKFDLDTDQGAAVKPDYTPPPPPSNTPSPPAKDTPPASPPPVSKTPPPPSDPGTPPPSDPGTPPPSDPGTPPPPPDPGSSLNNQLQQNQQNGQQRDR
ncbi:penicillin-binding protein [Streptomyces sp. NBC_01267]|uniref:transglycosylase domain-containing protein n=1 Tax=unclassified Streptomyces TaxID=2593676 RepID=UPI00224F7589|nr:MULTISPECIES: transglycosylase domain-containing protein [unclassified Streptomyces]MCX4548512.1 penicillin-binding protein [Streptomyces sp. NBC_01500]WSC20121.1 penicillin-binding protein [Streptomyces sp. NBC_01766]WSV54144.1 penicillin-binding protein [Streptomyces sp. NBC_01014]